MLPKNSVYFRALKKHHSDLQKVATFTTNQGGMVTQKKDGSTVYQLRGRWGQRTVIFYKCTEHSNLLKHRTGLVN